jgi:atypical dual specificity phosphatase
MNLKCTIKSKIIYFDLEMFSLPRYFRWIVPFFLSVMSTPRHERDIDALASAHIGIRHVITLTEEEPLPEEWFFNKTISHTHLPVGNYHAPTIEQVDLFFRLINDPTKTPLLIHCGGGKGRAGTMIACYLAVYGFQSPTAQEWTQPSMSAGEAIEKLRQLRPGSIETEEQERFVHTFVSTVWKRQSPLPPLPDEPEGIPLEIEGQLDGNIDFVMLCGVPGSGKSYVAQRMLTRDERWTIISQDETRSRDACEREVGRPGKYSKVILDRCNPDREDRKQWLALAHWAQKPICVYFDYNPDLCVSRAQQRSDHPTLIPGQRVRTAVQAMQRQMEKPRLNEGFVAVCIVRSFDAANELIKKLTPLGILKFLRTGHLMNLGAATSDDFLVSFNHTTHAPYVIITEKVDGANMGFSLSADRELLVQNRSHYITSTTHAQFRPLYVWIETHREGLYKVLDRDHSFPERYILYGEWLVAQHSIPYSRLPDRFLTFDLYDRETQTWADRDTLERLLEGTSISLVPIMYRGPRPADNVLKEMVHNPSQFYDGPVEGIYVKEEQNGQVVNRGKIVRSDFTAGITEHWDKAPMRKNGFVIDGDDIE